MPFVSESIEIRRATQADFEAIWSIFQAVIATGDTYLFSPDASRQDTQDYWFGAGITSFVAVEGERILGAYRLLANQRDLGSHVANASFMVSATARGKGIGKALGRHCLVEARRAGFRAMQFNFVVCTNTGAVALWKDLGFVIVGTLPEAFRHQRLGYVDAYVMYRFLDDIEV